MKLITGIQILFAKEVLGWKNSDLSKASEVSPASITRMQKDKGKFGIPSTKIGTTQKVQTTLDSALKEKGWQFTDAGGIEPIPRKETGPIKKKTLENED